MYGDVFSAAVKYFSRKLAPELPCCIEKNLKLASALDLALEQPPLNLCDGIQKKLSLEWSELEPEFTTAGWHAPDFPGEVTAVRSAADSGDSVSEVKFVTETDRSTLGFV